MSKNQQLLDKDQFQEDKAKRLTVQQWNHDIVSKLKQPWYLLQTCHNNNHATTNTKIYCNQKQLPEGTFYMRNFLSIDDESRLLQLIDDDDNDDNNSNKWSTVIARRQQFWGDVYYHTKHDVPAIQPAADNTLENNVSISLVSKTNNNNADNNKDKDYDDKIIIPPSLDISPMNWLLEKIESIDVLVDESLGGFFEYKGKLMAYYPNPRGVFTALKQTTPFIVQTNNEQSKYVNKSSCSSKTTCHDNNTGAVENPTQVLVNEYIGSIGIFSHIDDPFAFGQVLVMISLNEPVIMRLLKTTRTISTDDVYEHMQQNNMVLPTDFTLCNNNTNRPNETIDCADEVCVLLEPRSVLILKGQSRFEYEHSITKHKWIVVNHIHEYCKDNSSNNNIVVAVDDNNIEDDAWIDHTCSSLSNEESMNLFTSNGCSTFKTFDINPNSISDENVDDEIKKKYQNDVLIYRRNEEYFRRVSLTVRHLLDGRKRIPHKKNN
jgi:hypothetical protein